ncbi:MAG: VWA domain-containing protein [Bacteroidales bacterium]|nr:VWA domain-containing protein [Bacteroidales bacterium]
MFRFAHIEYVYLLALIPVFVGLFIWLMVWRKRALQRFGELSVIGQLLPDIANSKLILKFVLMIITWGLLVFVLVGPQTGSKLENVQRKGIDLIIALDVSNSMLAQDIKPSRIDRAKQAISRLVDKLEGDRIGIIVFAGKAYTQLPITTDYAAAKMFVSTINPGMVPTQGTAIGDAIDLAIQSFGESKKNKALVIISDGEDHQGSVLEQAELAASKGITIYTIGMGLPEGGPIPVYNGDMLVGFKKDKEGNAIVSKLDETLLQRIAAIGKGMYVRATSSETGLNKIFDDINAIQKSEIESKQFSDYKNQFQYFLAIALILMILDLFIFEKKTFWLKHIRPFETKS